MTGAGHDKLAKRIADAIECDLYGRHTIGRHAWDRLDGATLREIRKTWRRIIAAELEASND